MAGRRWKRAGFTDNACTANLPRMARASVPVAAENNSVGSAPAPEGGLVVVTWSGNWSIAEVNATVPNP